MPTDLAFHADPFCWEFEAEIIDQKVLPDGRRGVIMPKTFFYPTGGGQEHDTGMLGEARVTDVLIDDAGTVTHIIDRPMTGVVRATIDGTRRFAFMQHHSGQHLLSAAILNVLNIESVSANINIDNPATIDLDMNGNIDLTPAEDYANTIIYQDRAIKAYGVDETEIHAVPLRRPPKVSGAIRVIEIDGLDYSACGGTHCTRTGMIGIVKIVRTEHVNQKLRVHFLCGERALKHFQATHHIVTNVARQLDTNPEGILGALEKHTDSARALQKQVQELRELTLSAEAKELAAHAQALENIQLVTAAFRNRSAHELRALALHLQNEPGLVAVLASHDGAKVSIVVSSAADARVNANALIRKLLADINGRGGGDARIAQGGGAASEEQCANILANVRTRIREL